MRILIHSQAGDIGGIAWKMQEEGAKVDLFIKNPDYRRQMDGIVPKVDSMEEGLSKKPDVVLFDLNGDGHTADEIRKRGFKVVGGSALADKLEMQRAWGGKVAAQYGIRTPKTTEFKDVKTAVAFVKKENKPFAIKIDNNKSESSSYVSKDAEDMVGYLEQALEEKQIGSGDTFILQEVIHGAEISTELWFSAGDPIWPGNSTFETKKLLAGELGVRTGCETSLVCHYGRLRSSIVDKTIRKIFPLLKYAKWTGPVDINCIVSEKDHEPYFLEWTPRLGYSAIYAFMAVLGMPLSEFFRKLTQGPFEIPFKAAWGTSLKIHIPPYPVEIENDRAQKKTYGKAEGVRVNGHYSKDFIPVDIKKGRKTEFEVAGTSCIVGEAIGRGKTVIDAWRASQQVFKSVEVANKGGRYTDGILDAMERISKLRKWGYTDIPSPTTQALGTGNEITPFSPTVPNNLKGEVYARSA